MQYNIDYTAEAQRDLDGIWDHIASEFQNTSAANSIVNRIMDDVDQLETFPELGPLLSSIDDTTRSLRFLTTGNYITFYCILGSEIRIERILYGRRDYLACLFGKSLPRENS